MSETDFYERILGLAEPWFVADVQLDVDAQQLDLFVEHREGETFCRPDCDRKLPCHDHAKTRKWRHLDTMQFSTILHARTPRVKCPEHGVKQVKLPWAEKKNKQSLHLVLRTLRYQNRDNFKPAILFYCGGLDLYPQ